MTQRFRDLWCVLPCAALLVAFGAGILLRPHADFSEAENRALTDRVTLDRATLESGSLAAELSAFYSDQFPLRLWFTAAKARTERVLGKQENNGILFGAEGTLIPRTEVENETIAVRNLEAYRVFESRMEARGLPVTLLAAPRSADVQSEWLPALYRNARDPWIIEQIRTSVPDVLLPISVLQQAQSPYYKTDHHWTAEGAYLAYTELCRVWGLSPYPQEFFEEETVSTSFRGTAYAASGGITPILDTVTLYRYEGDERFTVTDRQTGEVRQGFYDRSAAERRNCYEIFLGGNFGRLDITDPNGGKPHLLLIKDSFANAMIPFLALHFDLTVVDLRYDRSSLSELLEQEVFDRVLVLQGANTLATDLSLCRLL